MGVVGKTLALGVWGAGGVNHTGFVDGGSKDDIKSHTLKLNTAKESSHY